MTLSIQFETRVVSSLVKVFADEALHAPIYPAASALRNQIFSFQAAYRSSARIRNMSIKVESDLQEAITVRRVGLVPSEYPLGDGHDGYALRDTPGLYPDPLYPMEEDGVTAIGGQWHSLWVSVALNEYTPAGVHAILISFRTAQGEPLGTAAFSLEVIPCPLPKMDLIHTEWLHADCIATHHQVDVLSEAHWSLIERYIQTAVKNGINMILTPLFTPPLDTLIGGERPTVQLVEVVKSGGVYEFGFDQLNRWVEMCRRSGVEYFEFSHLFTQWGARHAPKIEVLENGERKRLFGWDTDAAGAAYTDFLNQFLPELVSFIRRNNLDRQCFFHVSDEPNLDQLEAYASAAHILSRHVGSYPRIDALSDFAFYEHGLVPVPIPASDHIAPFLEKKVPDLWVYYCSGQHKDVSNRFFAHPSARTRIIGMQLYKFGIKGFLHWGFNFWYSQYSRRPVDPYRVTDCDYAFPSGDAFVVYPGPDGPIESLRLAVFHEALQDLRALRLLERYLGKEEVIRFLEGDLERPLTFGDYPHGDDWLLAKREQINRLIADHVG